MDNQSDPTRPRPTEPSGSRRKDSPDWRGASSHRDGCVPLPSDDTTSTYQRRAAHQHFHHSRVARHSGSPARPADQQTRTLAQSEKILQPDSSAWRDIDARTKSFCLKFLVIIFGLMQMAIVTAVIYGTFSRTPVSALVGNCEGIIGAVASVIAVSVGVSRGRAREDDS